MKIYLLKKQGKTHWQNMPLLDVVDNQNNIISLAGLYFIRKKDAKKYLEEKKYLYTEIISADVKKCKQDNRRK